MKCGEIWDMGEVLNTNLMTEKVWQNPKRRPKILKIASHNCRRPLEYSKYVFWNHHFYDFDIFWKSRFSIFDHFRPPQKMAKKSQQGQNNPKSSKMEGNCLTGPLTPFFIFQIRKIWENRFLEYKEAFIFKMLTTIWNAVKFGIWEKYWTLI